MRLHAERSLRPGLSLGLSLILVCLLSCPVLSVYAQTLTEVPPLTAHVVDLTGTLDGNQQRTLDQRLQVFEKNKGTQIAVLMVPGIGTEPIEQFALRVAERWKIGRKKIDDGAILVIAKNERRLRIEVGYGLEGALNDATAKRIIDEQIVPLFQRGDFYGGISIGIDTMMRVIEGEAFPVPAGSDNLAVGESAWLPLIFFAALMMSGLMRAMLGRVKGAIAAGGLLGVGAWLLSGVWILAIFSALIGLVITLAGGRMGSGWQGGRRHGGFNPYGGFGGGYGHGGGGFRGGGGGFGGGGASGRW